MSYWDVVYDSCDDVTKEKINELLDEGWSLEDAIEEIAFDVW